MPISTGSKDRTEVRAADRRILAGSNPRSEHVTHACLIEFFHQSPRAAALPAFAVTEAEVVQTCIITLDPVPAQVEDEFEALFAPESLIEEPGEEIDFDPTLSDAEIPEPMQNNRIDIGELTAQHLSLALNPYPQVDGAVFEGFDDGPLDEEEVVPEEPEKPNPFAALQRLKPRD